MHCSNVAVATLWSNALACHRPMRTRDFTLLGVYTVLLLRSIQLMLYILYIASIESTVKQKLKTTCGADDQGSFKYYVTLKAKELDT